MKYFVIDAFTDQRFSGNPAGICLLEQPLKEEIMQSIAAENHLSETAFLLPNPNGYDLRWFTPVMEVDLCGHATLGSAYVLSHYVDNTRSLFRFSTQSGELTVEQEGETYHLNFPSWEPSPCETPDGLAEALGVRVLQTHRSRDLVVVVPDERAVRNAVPDFDALAAIPDVLGFIITAQGDHCDFVSRFFAPSAGVNEDPATGSSHSTLIPFWGHRLSRERMVSRQLSARGGLFLCENRPDRVRIGGTAVCHMSGEILTDDSFFV